MPVKIRLMRIGTNKRPFYRVVAQDSRKKRTGGYLELLGTYNPLTTPKEIILKQDRIDDWIKKGAQPSDGFLRITGKAPQRPPRKPKKEKKEAPKAETPADQLTDKSDETGDQKASEPEAVAPVEQGAEQAPVENAQPEAEVAIVEEAPTEEPKTEETPATDQAEAPDSDLSGTTESTDTTETK